MNVSDYVTSLIRTYVPFIVGFVLSWLASKGVSLDAQAAVHLQGFLTLLFGGVYYAAARFLEHKLPKAGWLLGSVKKPEYTTPKE